MTGRKPTETGKDRPYDHRYAPNYIINKPIATPARPGTWKCRHQDNPDLFQENGNWRPEVDPMAIQPNNRHLPLGLRPDILK